MHPLSMKLQLNNTKGMWLSLVVGLVILNIWRWWPEDNAENSYSESDEVEITVAKLAVAVPEGSLQPEQGIARDLFSMQIPKKAAPVQPAKSMAVSQKPLPSAAQLAQREATAGLASFRLLATARRNGKMQAYLSRGESSLVVGEGMEFSRDYTAVKIVADSITIKHNNSGMQKEIRLSD